MTGDVRRLVNDLANITDRNTLRRLVVMAATRGGADALRLVGEEARREAMAHNLRGELHAARRRGDAQTIERCEDAMARLEVG